MAPGNALDVALAEFIQVDTALLITAGLMLTVVAPAAPLRLLDVPATGGRAVAAALNETAA